MPAVQANGIEINYEVQGDGEPMILIPYPAADLPPVDAFIRQSGAVLAHDATAVLVSVQAPTLITFGRPTW